MQKSDIAALHDHGFDDDQITIATQVIGYFNYINRIADGLGVDPDDWMTLPPDEWLANKARDYE
jgi:alkylhydroperoxidase family enzyme